MNASRRDLEIQFKRVVDNGWLPWFQREAKRAGTTTAHLLGIGSRETNLKNIRGDFRDGIYHGFGVMQVDIQTDPEYCRSWTPQNVEPSIRRGTDILMSKMRDTQNCVGKRVSVRGRVFIGKAVAADDLRRIATAAYNCGRWAHYHFSVGNNVDTTTTGHQYSRDVYDFAIEFADMLEERGYEKMAIHRELAMQGKYARTSHKEQFGYYGDNVPERVKLPIGEPQESQEELRAVEYERDSVNPFVMADETDVDGLVNNIGSDSTEQGSADSNNGLPQQPAINAVEQPEPGANGSPGVSGDGNQPIGDAPDAAPSSFLHLEDWKPFAARWLKRLWTTVTTITLPGGFGLGFMALKDPPNWFIYVAIAVVVLIVVFGLAIIVSLVLLAIWYFNRKEIRAGKELAAQSLIDPNSKNLGITIERK